jgi:hypothetical protein
MDQAKKKASNGRASTVAASQRLKPQRTLPTERLAAAKQLAILRAYAIASGPSNKAVKVKDAASIAKMAEATVSLCSAFFKDVGFLSRNSEGQLLPAAEVVEFNRAYDWNATAAPTRLAPLLRQSWFGERLLPKLQYAPMSHGEAVADLAEAAAAKPVYRPNLLILLDFLEAAGLIIQENGQVRLGTGTVSQRTEAAADDNSTEPTSSEAASRDQVKRETAPRLSTTFSQQEGVVQFHIGVKVNMSEFAGWSPDRITSFFAGIAQVLAAKGDAEEDAGGAR